jgi:hypothetical protein
MVYNGFDHPNNNSGIQTILSPCDTHQISIFDWYYSFDVQDRFFDASIDFGY